MDQHHLLFVPFPSLNAATQQQCMRNKSWSHGKVAKHRSNNVCLQQASVSMQYSESSNNLFAKPSSLKNKRILITSNYLPLVSRISQALLLRGAKPIWMPTYQIRQFKPGSELAKLWEFALIELVDFRFLFFSCPYAIQAVQRFSKKIADGDEALAKLAFLASGIKTAVAYASLGEFAQDEMDILVDYIPLDTTVSSAVRMILRSDPEYEIYSDAMSKYGELDPDDMIIPKVLLPIGYCEPMKDRPDIFAHSYVGQVAQKLGGETRQNLPLPLVFRNGSKCVFAYEIVPESTVEVSPELELIRQGSIDAIWSSSAAEIFCLNSLLGISDISTKTDFICQGKDTNMAVEHFGRRPAVSEYGYESARVSTAAKTVSAEPLSYEARLQLSTVNRTAENASEYFYTKRSTRILF